mmetsp:Transcript_31385/g.72239  ORF Transcript_31385/g.72239 Transcript_31385/m.72239 type:complete len:392 (-) Transcript_31385:95-1270(-)
MNLNTVLDQDYFFPDEGKTQIINDAAQIFAQVVQGSWWGRVQQDCLESPSTTTRREAEACPNSEYGILLFLSIEDKVCFIKAGSKTEYLLPWWRLGNIVWNMKTLLSREEYGKAVEMAMTEIQIILQQGPPSVGSRIQDFLSRFGVVLAFAVVTFLFGAWGEYRDRRKRRQRRNDESSLNKSERERATQLQCQQFQTTSCPICLETFQGKHEIENNDDDNDDNDENEEEGKEEDPSSSSNPSNWEIPKMGNDGKPIKMLRCGHIFDETCWHQWINSSSNSAGANACICPVCRQDVGKPKAKPPRSQNSTAADEGPQMTLWTRVFHGWRRNQEEVIGLRRNRNNNQEQGEAVETDHLLRAPTNTIATVAAVDRQGAEEEALATAAPPNVAHA